MTSEGQGARGIRGRTRSRHLKARQKQNHTARQPLVAVSSGSVGFLVYRTPVGFTIFTADVRMSPHTRRRHHAAIRAVEARGS